MSGVGSSRAWAWLAVSALLMVGYSQLESWKLDKGVAFRERAPRPLRPQGQIDRTNGTSNAFHHQQQKRLPDQQKGREMPSPPAPLGPRRQQQQQQLPPLEQQTPQQQKLIPPNSPQQQQQQLQLADIEGQILWSEQDVVDKCWVGSMEEGPGRTGNKMFVIFEVFVATEILNVTGCVLQGTLNKLTDFFVTITRLPKSIYVVPDRFRETWVDLMKNNLTKGRSGIKTFDDWSRLRSTPKLFPGVRLRINTLHFCIKELEEERNRRLFSSVFELKPDVKRFVKEYLERISERGSKTVFTLHIRRTDRIKKGTRNPFAWLKETVTVDGRNETRATPAYFPSYPYGYHEPESIIRAMKKSAKLSNTNLSAAVFAVASDDPGWCRKNIVDREGKMQINVTHDHYRGRKDISGPAFDFALLRLSDHRILTYSQFGASAAVLREKDSGYNFIVRDHPGKGNGTLATHMFSYEVWRNGMSAENYPLV